jgi:glyceraldehyde-3-phosphate dehydrogenase/erythrose-4-phosphate dehydrogenase
MALNVPVLNGSLSMTMFTQKPITKTAVNEVVRTGINAKFSRYVEYVQDPTCRATLAQPLLQHLDSPATTQPESTR